MDSGKTLEARFLGRVSVVSGCEILLFYIFCTCCICSTCFIYAVICMLHMWYCVHMVLHACCICDTMYICCCVHVVYALMCTHVAVCMLFM